MSAPHNLRTILNSFRSFLAASWSSSAEFEKFDRFENFRIDWLQSNWELMVEDNVLNYPDFLEVYGDGADRHGASSRISFPDKFATKRIICSPSPGQRLQDLITGDRVDLGISHVVFDRFVRMTKDNWFEEAPEFDCILCTYRETEVVVPFEITQFELMTIEA